MGNEEPPDQPEDSNSISRVHRALHGVIGFIRGFSFGRHLDRRYD